MLCIQLLLVAKVGRLLHIAPYLAVCQTTLRAQKPPHRLLLVPKHIVKSRLITLMPYHFVYLMPVGNSDR